VDNFQDPCHVGIWKALGNLGQRALTVADLLEPDQTERHEQPP
jgi:hypothetical protein